MSGRRGRRPFARRLAAPCRAARRARARRRSSGRLLPPCACRQDVIQRRPFPSSSPTWRLRLRSPVHVNTRSPRPLSPASVSRRRSFGAGETRDLGKPARDERSHGVVPESEPFDHSGGNRDHVLQCAADLDARDIVARVEAHAAAAKLFLHRAAARASVDAASTAAGRPRAISDAKLGPDSTTTGKRACSLLLDHLRHSLKRLRLEAFGRADDHGVRRERCRGHAHDSADAVGRHRHHHELRVVHCDFNG